MAQSPQNQPFGLWQEAAGPVRVEYSRHVMETIRAAASHAMHGIGRGGVEVGGVLLGTRLGNFFRVLDWREIPCGHSRGPSFLLSAEEHAAMATWLEDLEQQAESRNLQVIGWSVSHTRSSLDLTGEERELHARFFPKEWQLALVLQPSKFGDVEGRFYLRRPETAERPTALEPLIAVAPLPVEVKAKKRKDAESEEEPLDPIEAQPGRRVSRLWPVLAVLVLAVLAAASVVVGVMPGMTDRVTSLLWATKLEPYDTISLQAAMTAQDAAEISWNGDIVQARGINRAVLEIRDGASTTQKELSRGELYMGRMSYPLQSARADISLALYDGQVLLGHESTRFRRPANVTAPQ